MDSLPLEVIEVIANYLTAQEVCSWSATSSYWRDVLNNDLFWRWRCKDDLGEVLLNEQNKLQSDFLCFKSNKSSFNDICEWKNNYIRENLLWNNWRFNNYKQEVFLDTRISVENFKPTFLNEHFLMFASWDYKPIFWNLSSDPVQETQGPFKFISPEGTKELIYFGDSGALVIEGIECIVQVYNLSSSDRQWYLDYVFMYDKNSLISINEVEELLYSRDMFLSLNSETYTVIGTFFVATDRTKLHIWNLSERKKIQEVNCFPNKSSIISPHVIPDLQYCCIVSSNWTENVVIVCGESVLSDVERCFDVNYRVYSLELKKFISFCCNFKCDGGSQSCQDLYRSCAFNDKFIVIELNGRLNVYNYDKGCETSLFTCLSNGFGLINDMVCCVHGGDVICFRLNCKINVTRISLPIENIEYVSCSTLCNKFFLIGKKTREYYSTVVLEVKEHCKYETRIEPCYSFANRDILSVEPDTGISVNASCTKAIAYKSEHLPVTVYSFW